MSKITCVATGDYLVDRRIAQDSDFQDLRNVIQAADARITNLETTISWQEGTPNGFNGGAPLFTSPDRLEDLKAYGFNLVATANNHTLDYGEDGLKYTLGYLRQYGIINAGSGMNKAEAARPAYLETAGGRVALISVCSSLVKPWYPEEQRRDMKGRPGANGLKCYNDLRLTKEQFEVLKQIKETTHVTNLVDMMVDQGFITMPQDMIAFGFDIYCFPMLFRLCKEGEQPGMTTYPDFVGTTMKDMVHSVKDARLGADMVVINMHGHEMKAREIGEPADFHGTAAKAWIDAGADAVVIEGAHQTRGVEIYKGRPIFYSLGNFIFHNTTTVMSQSYHDEMRAAPGDTYNMIVEKSKSNPEYLWVNPKVMTSVFAGWEMEDGKITSITLYPIDLHMEKPMYARGTPSLTGRDDILDRVIELSKPYGTRINKEHITTASGKKVLIGRILL